MTLAMGGFLHAGKGGHLDAPHRGTSGSAPCLRSLPLLAGYTSKSICVNLCHCAPPCGGWLGFHAPERCLAEDLFECRPQFLAQQVQAMRIRLILEPAHVLEVEGDPLLVLVTQNEVIANAFRQP